jgi:hypothetical protein
MLVERNYPAPNEKEKKKILAHLWNESVVLINTVAPINGQTAQTHMLPTTPEKPFETNVKETVAIKTLKKYERECELMYAKFGDECMDVQGRFETR